MREVIDAHVHLSGRNDDALIPYAYRNGLKYDLAELLRLMGENGVVKALLLSPPLNSGGPLPNEYVIRLCAQSGGLLLPVVTVEPGEAEVSAALSLARKNRQVRGFKIRLGYVKVFADDPVYAPLYDYAESAGLPVLFHTGDTASSEGSLAHSHPLTLDALANSRPELKMVACHFGNPWFEDVAELTYKHPNLYADISGLVVGGSKYGDKYEEWVAKKLSSAIHYSGGAEKIIFGSDYPVTTQEKTIGLVGRLDVDEGDVERILCGNSRRLFKL